MSLLWTLWLSMPDTSALGPRWVPALSTYGDGQGQPENRQVGFKNMTWYCSSVMPVKGHEGQNGIKIPK